MKLVNRTPNFTCERCGTQLYRPPSEARRRRFCSLPCKNNRPVESRYTVDPETGCWIWNGAPNDSGYGQLRAGEDGRTVAAHRWMYEMVIGEIPDGLQIDHLCRNRMCVNPDHLEPVTQTENQRRGLNTKLSPDDVRAIRRRAQTEKRADLASEFGVSTDHVRNILRRRIWRDIE